MDMNKYEYLFLTGTWEGVKGAAYNATYDFCREFGWCDSSGEVTKKGRQALKQYEYLKNAY